MIDSNLREKHGSALVRRIDAIAYAVIDASTNDERLLQLKLLRMVMTESIQEFCMRKELAVDLGTPLHCLLQTYLDTPALDGTIQPQLPLDMLNAMRGSLEALDKVTDVQSATADHYHITQHEAQRVAYHMMSLSQFLHDARGWITTREKVLDAGHGGIGNIGE
jgi:hypothetical protein